eukprot:g8122.t1
MHLRSPRRRPQILGVDNTHHPRFHPLKKLSHQSKIRSPSSLLVSINRLHCTSINRSGSPVSKPHQDTTTSVQYDKNTTSIELALDYYSILKARRVNSAESLKRSYEELLAYVPDDRYTKQTMIGREAILHKAAETMLDSDKRREYDQSLSNNQISKLPIPDQHFSGALLLLHESDEIEQVIELGTQWLNRNGVSTGSKDVALSVAKAYCDLASITLDSGKGIALCCEELETALELLTVCDVAPDLQNEIHHALKELRPQFILEQLALPEDDPKLIEKREKGLSQLKDLLWELDDDGNLSPSINDRQAFLEKARPLLTAAQQIEIFESCPKDLMIPVEELYDSAMAYVAEGYHRKWPQHIQKAERVLKQFQKDSMSTEFTESDVSVELALCDLLLGHKDRSMMTLGLLPGASKVPDKAVVAFVKSHSPSEEDLLPGVYALAEVWLKDTLIPNYKEISTLTNSLGEWFQSPTVAVYLRLIEQGTGMRLNSVMEFATRIIKGITNTATKTAKEVKSVFQRPKVENQNQVESVGRLKLTKFDKKQKMQTPGGPGESNPRLDVAKDGTGRDEFIVESPEETRDWWKEVPDPLDDQTSDSKPLKNSFINKFWRSFLFTSTIVILVAVGRFTLRNSGTELRPMITSTVSNVVQDLKDYFELGENQDTIDFELAEELIRQWYDVKSQALGADHEVEKLDNVLHGNMLRQWQQRAKSLKQDGLYWEYTLKDLTVDAVSPDGNGRHVVVEVSIKEKAQLMKSKRKVDSYSTRYSIQYDLIKKRQEWKITAATVMYQSS